MIFVLNKGVQRHFFEQRGLFHSKKGENFVPAVEVPIEKWTGKIREVTLGGGGRKQVVVGGETTLPFLKFEGQIPHAPAIAIEVRDLEPKEWPSSLLSAWGDVVQDPVAWAKKAGEVGAEVIFF